MHSCSCFHLSINEEGALQTAASDKRIVPVKAAFLLMAQHDGAAVIPIEYVCRDYFAHLTPEKLARKISMGEIALPLLRIEASQKSAKGVHLLDLANWVDQRAELARKECRQLCA